MNKHIVIDAGGSKVAAIIYDDQFRPLAAGRTGSMRSNTTSPEMIEQHQEEIFRQLGLSRDHPEHFASARGTLPAGILVPLAEFCRIDNRISLGETEMGLAAAGIFGDGALAVSGTGATLTVRQNGRIQSTGGYGCAVYDDACGYGLGRGAIRAAIEDEDGLGPKTMMKDLFLRRFGKKSGTPMDLRDAIWTMLHNTDTSASAMVASCAPMVSQAARAGDPVALQMLEKKGYSLGRQMGLLLRRTDAPMDLPTTISGSAWRGYHLFFDSYVQGLRDSGVTREPIVPEFEPILGLMIQHFYEVNGKFGPEDAEAFRTLYPDYLFQIERA